MRGRASEPNYRLANIYNNFYYLGVERVEGE